MSVTRYQGQIQSAVGDALDGALIYVCTQPNSIDPVSPAIPPSPLAVLYTNASGSVQSANPVVSDGNGNYHFYTSETIVTLVIYDVLQRIEPIVLPDIPIQSGGGGGGGGTVTSVSLAMPVEFAVAGSPVTGAGGFNVTKQNQNAGTIYAGPATGPAAPPTFQDALTWLDTIGVGDGTVTSVALALVLSSLLSGSVSGSPITSSGTLGLTLGLANQLANTFLAGPASGGIGPVTARKIAAADIFGLVPVSFSATPTFDASAFAIPTFTMTITGNVLSSTVSNPTNGQEINFVITQNGSGGNGFTWPADFKGAMTVDTTANSINLQSFVRTADGFWRAKNTGITLLS